MRGSLFLTSVLLPFAYFDSASPQQLVSSGRVGGQYDPDKAFTLLPLTIGWPGTAIWAAFQGSEYVEFQIRSLDGLSRQGNTSLAVGLDGDTEILFIPSQACRRSGYISSFAVVCRDGHPSFERNIFFALGLGHPGPSLSQNDCCRTYPIRGRSRAYPVQLISCKSRSGPKHYMALSFSQESPLHRAASEAPFSRADCYTLLLRMHPTKRRTS